MSAQANTLQKSAFDIRCQYGVYALIFPRVRKMTFARAQAFSQDLSMILDEAKKIGLAKNNSVPIYFIDEPHLMKAWESGFLMASYPAIHS